MDQHRFDTLTRQVGRGLARRDVLRLVVGLLAGGGALAASDAAAGRPVCRAAGSSCTRTTQCCSGRCPTGRAVPRQLRNRCACPLGEALCGGACVDVTSNRARCGACDRVCASGEICVSGACVDDPCDGACTAAETCCSGVCANLSISAQHCGACDDPCPAGEICVAGVCAVSSCEGSSAPQCFVTTENTRVEFDGDTCGDWTTTPCAGPSDCQDAAICPPGSTCACALGWTNSDTSEVLAIPVCVARYSACPGGLECCFGQCVDTQTSQSNCGTCGVACFGGTCTAGSCG